MLSTLFDRTEGPVTPMSRTKFGIIFSHQCKICRDYLRVLPFVTKAQISSRQFGNRNA